MTTSAKKTRTDMRNIAKDFSWPFASSSCSPYGKGQVTAETESDAAKLIGTWSIVSDQRTIVETGETIDANVGVPSFGLSQFIAAMGSMLGLLLRGRRPKPASVDQITDPQRIDLFKSMVAYGGRYTLDGNKVAHHIDISWNEVWTGTTQFRHVSFDGERLVLTTEPTMFSRDGKMSIVRLVWSG